MLVNGCRESIQGRSWGTKDTHIKQPCVYILASNRNGTLYIGVTSSLVQRVWQHRHDLVEGFTKRYGIRRLVWYQAHNSMQAAIGREQALKQWKRAWKLRLIEEGNPDWKDLTAELY